MPEKRAPAKKTAPKSAAKKPAKKAAKKPAKKTAAAAKTTKKPRAAAPALAAAARAALLVLPARFNAPIDRPIKDILNEAAELEATMGTVGETLYAKSKLTHEIGESLSERKRILEAAEAEWHAKRTAALVATGLVKHRDEAEALKTESIAALRHFKEEDAAIQAKVDAIVEGSGLVDLIDDCKKLAPLVAANAAELVKSDLAGDAAARLLDLAEKLEKTSTGEAVDKATAAEKEIRDRAFWFLRETMDAIRSAGRYAFRNQPKVLTLFRATSTRARHEALRGGKRAAKSAPAKATKAAKTTNKSADKPAAPATNGKPAVEEPTP